MFLTTGFAFLAGVITVLSPCVLPLLPVILATAAQEGRARPVGVMIGFVGSFTVATLALSYLVRALGLPPDINRLAAGYILILLGLVLAVPVLHSFFRAFRKPGDRPLFGRRCGGAEQRFRRRACRRFGAGPCLEPLRRADHGLGHHAGAEPAGECLRYSRDIGFLARYGDPDRGRSCSAGAISPNACAGSRRMPGLSSRRSASSCC